jgi:subtilisin family serine protease
VGGNLDHSFILRVGPPSIALVAPAANVHRVIMIHGTDPAVGHPSGGTVRRHNVDLAIFPKVSGKTTVSYAEGIYEVRIKAPAGTEVFAMGGIAGFAKDKLVVFGIAATMADGGPLDPGIDVTSDFTAVDTSGANVITVAAYSHAGPDAPKIAKFSSRGPLRDFSDPPGSKPLIADKPDLAAPGVDIMAAESRHTKAYVANPDRDKGIRFVEHSGTSMAAPFVAGLVALMFDKKKDLNITEARTALKDAAATRTGEPGLDPPAAPADRFKRAYGSGMVHGIESHKRTP